MDLLSGICLIVVYFTVARVTMCSRRYVTNPNFDDKKLDVDLLGKYSAKTMLECAMFCQKECGVFGYNNYLKKCRTYKNLNTSSVSQEAGWRYMFSDLFPMDCKELHDNGQWQSGVYDIYPPGTRSLPLKAYCDMSTMGGGWTAIQKRISGSLSFKQSWSEYKNGFGTPDQNVWIGNDAINQLTKGRNSFLYVSITLVNGTTLYELYDQFSVSDETQKYQLFLGGPATGTLGDSMLHTPFSWANLSGMYFSTKDRDNDRADFNCAAHWGGGWWFNHCHEAFLNGPWYPEYWRRPWNPTVGNIDQTSETYIRETKMMIKRHKVFPSRQTRIKKRIIP